MPRRLSDPVDLRALAHPVRMAIVEQLSLDGPMTATELADRLDETPANCSWHLRKLAERGFIEEAPSDGQAQGRRRPWRMVEIGFSWGDAGESAEGLHAALALSDVVMGRSLDRYRDSAQRQADEPQAWQDASTGNQTMAWLTAEELRGLNDEIREVVLRHVDRLEDPAKRPEGSRLCELVSWGIPVHVPGFAQQPGEEQA